MHTNVCIIHLNVHLPFVRAGLNNTNHTHPFFRSSHSFLYLTVTIFHSTFANILFSENLQYNCFETKLFIHSKAISKSMAVADSSDSNSSTKMAKDSNNNDKMGEDKASSVNKLASSLSTSLSLHLPTTASSSTASGHASSVVVSNEPVPSSTTHHDHCSESQSSVPHRRYASSNSHDASKLSNLSSLHGLAQSQSVPKYGTPVPNRVFVGGIPTDVSALVFSIPT